MKNRNRIIPLVIYMVVLFAAFSGLGGLFGSDGNAIPYSEVISLFQHEQVKEFTVEGDRLTMVLHEAYNGETRVVTDLSDPDGFRRQLQPLFLDQAERGILLSYDFVSVPDSSPYDLVLPLIIAGLILLFVWAILMGKMNSGNPLQNFGKAPFWVCLMTKRLPLMTWPVRTKKKKN